MLTKNAKYYFDQEAVREDNHSNFSDIKKMLEKKDRLGGKTLEADDPMYKANKKVNIGKKRGVGDPFGRNRRSVWQINTTPFPAAHFATFPPKLVEIPILAGTSEHGCCANCGAPYKRIMEKLKVDKEDREKKDKQFRARGSNYQLATGYYEQEPDKVAQRIREDGRKKTPRAESNTKYDTENDSAGRLATYRQGQRKSGKNRRMNGGDGDLYNSKYVNSEHGQALQGFVRTRSILDERDASREEAKVLFPESKELQQAYINYIHDHGHRARRKTIGWEKTCKCETDERVQCIVLDPFMGSGTTGMVALDLHRSFIGIELGEQFKKMQLERFGEKLNQYVII